MAGSNYKTPPGEGRIQRRAAPPYPSVDFEAAEGSDTLLPGAPNTNKYKQLSPGCADWLSRGCTITGTAAQFGIGRETLRYWLKHQAFKDLVDSKREEWRKGLLADIEGANHWVAKAWLLERVFKGDYVQPRQAPQGTGPVQVNVMLGNAPGESGGTKITVGESPVVEIKTGK